MIRSKYCEFNQKLVCKHCGFETKISNLMRICRPSFRNSSNKKLKQNPMYSTEIFVRLPKIMLGDLIEKILTFIGITKERIYKLTRQQCNCPARQQWLNSWWLNKTIRLEMKINLLLKKLSLK